jgi:hypothetical protein
MTPDVATLQAAPSCPACARRETLVMLGDRVDRAHPWFVWRTRRAFIYLCLHCEAVVALEEPRTGRGQRSSERPPSARPVIVMGAG